MKKLTSVFLSVMFILQLCNPLSATESVSQNSIILRSAEVPAGMNLGVSAVALHTDLSSAEAVLPHTLVFSENADFDSSSYEEYYPVTILESHGKFPRTEHRENRTLLSDRHACIRRWHEF